MNNKQDDREQLGTCDMQDELHTQKVCELAWHRNWTPRLLSAPPVKQDDPREALQ